MKLTAFLSKLKHTAEKSSPKISATSVIFQKSCPKQTIPQQAKISPNLDYTKFSGLNLSTLTVNGFFDPDSGTEEQSQHDHKPDDSNEARLRV
jgi:hypothetical protein